MRAWRYRYQGLHVFSELELPEWAAFHSEFTCAADVEISLAKDSEKWLAEPGCASQFIDAREYRFCIQGIGLFQVRDGRRIAVAPQPGAKSRQIRPYVLGSAWGALCYQADIFLVHASAVRVGGEAILFCAPPGAGKSTLAAHLIRKGFALLSDDTCRIDVPALGVPAVHPSAPRLRLWRDALLELGCKEDQLEPDHKKQGKFNLTLSAEQSPEPLPLRAIYLLNWGDCRIERLFGLSALSEFLPAATYRAEWLEPMRLLHAHSMRCAELLRRVPLYQFWRPRDLSGMNEATDTLTRSWF